MSSRTKIISIDKLARDPVLGSVLVRLMMVINDNSICDESVRMWKGILDESRRVRVQEAFKYFVELQIAHIYEGLQIIREINLDAKLKRYVDLCDRPTRGEFAQLVDYLVNPKYEAIMGRMRNNLAFHYSAKLTRRALEKHVRKTSGSLGAISMGSTSADWLFEPGALVNELVAVREVFAVPDGADITGTTDQEMMEVQRMAEAFMRFAGHFIWKHTTT